MQVSKTADPPPPWRLHYGVKWADQTRAKAMHSDSEDCGYLHKDLNDFGITCYSGWAEQS